MILPRLLTMLLLLGMLTTSASAQVPFLPPAEEPANREAASAPEDQSVQQLIEILENDTARQVLIERLRGAAGEEA